MCGIFPDNSITGNSITPGLYSTEIKCPHIADVTYSIVTLARLPGYIVVCENCNIKEDTGDWSGVYTTDYKYT